MKKLVLLMMVLAAVAGMARAGLPDTSKMNVLFIIAEDWSARTPGCYGNTICKTPNLDKFATTAVRFDRAYVQAIACNPSRSSFLSGLRPLSTNVWNNGQEMDVCLPPETITLPELFKNKGYTTAVIGKFFHTTAYAEKQLMSFDRIESYQPPPGWKGPAPILGDGQGKAGSRKASVSEQKSAMPGVEKAAKGGKKKGGKGGKGGGAKAGKDGGTAVQKTPAQRAAQRKQSDRYGDSGKQPEEEGDYRNAQIAIALINEFAKDKSKPFFMSVHQSRPHTPLIAPKQYLDMYDPNKIPDPPAPRESLVREPYQSRVTGGNPDIFTQKPATPQQTREAIAAYYACVTMVDRHIGMILEALDKAGMADNTIVFIMGDHGWHLGDHGFWSKYSLHEEVQRAPLWVRVPGAAGNGKVCSEFVEFVDYMSTLGQLVGLNVPKNVEGISFAPLLDKPDTPWKKAVFQVQSPEDQTVRTKQYRYMELAKGPVTAALYDEEKDPWETKNLAGDPAYAKVEAEMKALLKAGWKAGLPEKQ